VQMEPTALFPRYNEWLEVYSAVKEFCAFAEAIDFVQRFPDTVNNRKGGEGGWTLLHQAAFWAVDRGILIQLQQAGANPCLLDRDHKTPLHCTESSQFETDFIDVFGNTDLVRPFETLREILDAATIDEERFKKEADLLSNGELHRMVQESCKYGDFAMAIRFIALFPFLRNTQSVTGWSVLHQACFHGVGRGIFSRLRQLGVSSSLLTNRGEDAAAIAEQSHAGTNVTTSFAEIFGNADAVEGSSVEVNQQVHLATAGAETWILGTVVDINREERTVRVATATGETFTEPLWRVSLVKTDNSGVGEEELTRMMHECSVCCQPILMHRISPSCADSPDGHATCPECCVNSLWAAFTGGTLPPACSLCRGPVNFAKLNTRMFMSAWARRHPTLPFQTFIANVEEKQTRIAAGPVTWESLDPATRTHLEAEIAAGKLMRCMQEGCGQPFAKESGCNWVKCLFCKAENCWQTKKLAGRGDGKCGGGHSCHY
jgi:hypothetical protein